MLSVKLPARLEEIARMVPDGAKLADVGTDHGLLPIRLLLEGRIRTATASDIRSGPLSRARVNAEAYGAEDLRFVLCDGLQGISPEDADTIVIAGMGGETIVSILMSAPWVCRGTTLLLQPMSHPEILRRALCSVGLRITEERLVMDNGRLYSIIKACEGEPLTLSEAEYSTGPYDLIKGQKLFSAHLGLWMKKTRTAMEGLSCSVDPADIRRLEFLGQLYEQFEQMIKGDS